LTVAYVGALSHNLAFANDINYPGPTATSQSVDSRRPIEPGILSNIFITQSIGTDAYHSLQVSVDKRFSHGFSLKGFYVFSRDIESIGSSAQDLNNLAAERALSDIDRRHSIVLSTIWDLNYVPKTSMLSYALNGWHLSTITTLQSGIPFNVTTGADTNKDGNTTDRPNLVGDPFLDSHRGRSVAVNAWFDKNAFVVPAAGQDGNAPRNFLIGPGLRKIDVGIFRSFGVAHERVNMQFRAEMTNAFNMVSLRNPVSNMNSPQFGKISGAQDPRQIQLGMRLSF